MTMKSTRSVLRVSCNNSDVVQEARDVQGAQDVVVGVVLRHLSQATSCRRLAVVVVHQEDTQSLPSAQPSIILYIIIEFIKIFKSGENVQFCLLN